jgi:hypothetical protein
MYRVRYHSFRYHSFRCLSQSGVTNIEAMTGAKDRADNAVGSGGIEPPTRNSCTTQWRSHVKKLQKEKAQVVVASVRHARAGVNLDLML